MKKRAGFDINSINPIDYAPRAFIPAFFGHARADTFVKPHHTQRLHAEYSGDKELMLFEDDCDHNSPRPTAFYEAVRSFLSRALHLSNDTSPGQQAMLADVNRLMPDSNAGVLPSLLLWVPCVLLEWLSLTDECLPSLAARPTWLWVVPGRFESTCTCGWACLSSVLIQLRVSFEVGPVI